jgi:putative addiction module killer protein
VSISKIKRIQLYLRENGKCPFEDWFLKLKDGIGKAHIAARIEKIRQGLESNQKSVGAGVLESKIYSGPGYRLYFGLDGDEIVILLLGGSKQRQDADINKAKEYWKDYEEHKNAKAK